MKNRNWKRLMALALSAVMLIAAPQALAVAEGDVALSAQERNSLIYAQEVQAEEEEGEGEEEKTYGDFVYQVVEDYDEETGSTYDIYITGYNGSGGNVTIPAQIEGKDVAAISSGAFSNCGNITGVTIPNGVRAIMGSAFHGCSNLAEITIPDSVASIGEQAFEGTKWLENKKAENPLVIAGKIVIEGEGCSGNVVIPDGVTLISDSAFAGNKNITAIMIPASVTVIEAQAFDYCIGLTSITISEGVASIGKGAFMRCSGLENITIPGSIIELGSGAFSACANLNSVKIMENVKKIRQNAFSGCYSLESIAIPASVTAIGEGAIPDSEKVTIYGKAGSYAETYATENGIAFSTGEMPIPKEKIVISDGDVSLDRTSYYVFESTKRPQVTVECQGKALTQDVDYTVWVFNNYEVGTATVMVTGMGDYKGTVEKKFAINPAPEGFNIGESAYDSGGVALFSYNGNAKDVVIPEGVQIIVQGSIGNNVTSVTIPASVRRLYNYVGIYGYFLGAGDLEEVKVDAGSQTFMAKDGILYSKDGTILYYYPIKKSGILNIPAEVSDISAYDISERSGMTGVTVDSSNPNFTAENGILYNKDKTSLIACVPEPSGTLAVPGNVKDIANGALANCNKLTNVTIPQGVTLIGNSAFFNCGNLESVTIPDSVTSIGISAFMRCEKLTIYGKEGSYAQTFARENNIKFSTGKPGDAVNPPEKAAQVLNVTKTYDKAYGNKAFKLNAKCAKGDGKLAYASSNPGVVTVDNSGTAKITGTGVATVTVTAAETANYKKATASILVKVSPAKMSLKSLKAAKGRKLIVSWKKDARATGYEIQYGTDKKFKNKKATKTITVKKNKTTSTVLKKLTKGKKYYVRLRAYKSDKVNGKTQKLYGAWSSQKRSGKIKK